MQRLTVKNYKHAEWASEETDCFTASIYLDGKKLGTARNEGRGGCNHYLFDSPEKEKAFYAYVEEWKNLPEVRNDPEHQINGECFVSDESLVGEACDNYRREREMKKVLGNYETVLRIERPEPGSMVSVLTTLLPKGYDVKAEIASEAKQDDKVFIYTKRGGVEAR